MKIENTYGNNTTDLLYHLKTISLKEGPMPRNLGIRRFKLLRQSMKPHLNELKELCQLLCNASQRYIK